jgi:pimeloyl-ACP methyl ester carboxylesterase
LGTNPDYYAAFAEQVKGATNQRVAVHIPPSPRQQGKKPHCILDYFLHFVEYLQSKRIQEGIVGGHSFGAALAIWFAEYVDAIRMNRLGHYARALSPIEAVEEKTLATKLQHLAPAVEHLAIDRLFLANPFIPTSLYQLTSRALLEMIKRTFDSPPEQRLQLREKRETFDMLPTLGRFGYSNATLDYLTLLYFADHDEFFPLLEKSRRAADNLAEKFPHAYVFEDLNGNHKSGCVLSEPKLRIVSSFLLEEPHSLDMIVTNALASDHYRFVEEPTIHLLRGPTTDLFYQLKLAA